MIKTVFDNSMVAHVWAQGQQSAGRSHNGQFYFEGPTLYSYGSHFVVGRLMPEGVALLNADKYSISTSRHQSEARSAARHLTCYHVPDLTSLLRRDPFHKGNCSYSAKIIKAHLLAHPGTAPDVAEYLLGFAGVKPVAKARAVFERIKDTAQRKAAKAAKKRNRDAAKLEMGYGRQMVAMTPADFAAYVESQYPAQLEQSAVRLHRAYKAEKAAGHTRHAAAAWAVLGQVRAIVRHQKATDAREQANKNAHKLIKEVRSAFDTIRDALAEGRPILSEPGRLAQWLRHSEACAVRLADQRFIGRPLAGKLAALAAGYAVSASIAHAEAARLAEIEQAEAIAAWIRGDIGARNHALYGLPRVLIRATGVTRDDAGEITGGSLETTMGAEVPLTHAVRAFRFLKLIRAKYESTVAIMPQAAESIAWRANGHTLKVGHFGIEWVQADGTFKAGCHVIEWAETERLARELGVFEALPADTTEAR